MHNIIAMAIIERVSESFDDLADLSLCFTPVSVFGVIQFSSLHALHYNVEIVRVVIHFVNLNNVGMLKLN